MLAVGIVGLPNVGKSTLFNALAAGDATVSNYPFTTIDSNVGVVPVPDPRLATLEQLLAPAETTPCAIRFVDVAGLVEGASRGEGLGNRFLGEIRPVDAVAHVVRCFPTAEVAHVLGGVDPVRDAEVVEGELRLADLELLERTVERREKLWQTRPREHQEEQGRLLRYRTELAAGRPLRGLELAGDDRAEAKALGLLTAKPLLYVANVADDALGGAEPPAVAALRRYAGTAAARVVTVSAKIEGELAELAADERAELATALGLERSGLERLVEAAFELLDLVRFYTVVHGKLQAWEIPRTTPARDAARRIHSDMAEGFIRARVTTVDELARHGSLDALQRLGLVRVEGKEYPIADGDVVEFLFQP